jgi:2-polyprenyl-3-methyl-5-hydroxy-6-metoxy-1,4-benzoquinol methylase
MLEGVEEREDYWESHASHDGCGELTDALGESAGGELDYWSRARRSYFDAALDLLEGGEPPEGRRILDIGGGPAFFAERALDRGWDCYSLDVSPSARQLAARRIGEERAWLVRDERLDGSFDVVTLWCVIAHTSHPRALVEEAAAALRPRGRVWITTPNFAFQRTLYAKLRPVLVGKSFDFGAPDHMGHFGVKALNRLLELTRFEDARVHFQAVTDVCLFTGYSRSRRLVRAKHLWNRVAMAAARIGLPNLMSELQVTARK